VFSINRDIYFFSFIGVWRHDQAWLHSGRELGSGRGGKGKGRGGKHPLALGKLARVMVRSYNFDFFLSNVLPGFSLLLVIFV
jgi:hypothetical protein